MGRNILFVTTDQQRYDALGCNGGTIARTPVVDELAARPGIIYRRAYNQNTVCMPARSHHAHRPVPPHPRRGRQRHRPARRRPQRRRVPGRAGRIPHRADRQGALRARVRSRLPLGGERPRRPRRHRAVARASSTPSTPSTSPPSGAGRCRTTDDGWPSTIPSTSSRSPRCSAPSPAATPAPPRPSTTRFPAAGTTPTGSPIAASTGSTRCTTATTGSAGSASPIPTTRGIRPSPRCTGSTGASSTCRPAIRVDADQVRKVLADKPAHWLALVRGHVRQRRGRTDAVLARVAHARPGAGDQRPGPRDERADRRGASAACSRPSTPGAGPPTPT